MTQSYPSDTKIGFSVITTTRAFHLFAATEQIKAEFIYALASLKAVPVRPPLAYAYQQYVTYWKPALAAAKDPAKRPAVPAPKSPTAPAEKQPDSANKAPEKEKALPAPEELINSSSTNETAKPSGDVPAKEESPVQTRNPTVEQRNSVESPARPQQDDKKPDVETESNHSNVSNCPSSELVPDMLKAEEKEKEKEQPQPTVVEKARKSSEPQQKAKVRIIDCEGTATSAHAECFSKPAPPPPMKRVQRPETIRIQRNGSGPCLSHTKSTIRTTTANPFECGGEHRPRPLPVSKLGPVVAKPPMAPAQRVEEQPIDLLELLQRDECGKENLKNPDQNNKGRQVEEAKTGRASMPNSLSDPRDKFPVAAQKVETFEYDWDGGAVAKDPPYKTARLPLQHEQSLPQESPARLIKAPAPARPEPKLKPKPVATEKRPVQQPMKTEGAGKKGETFEEAW